MAEEEPINHRIPPLCFDTEVSHWGWVGVLPQPPEAEKHQGFPACHYAQNVMVFPGLPKAEKDPLGGPDIITQQHSVWTVVEGKRNLFIGKSKTVYAKYGYVRNDDFFATEEEAMKVAQEFHRTTKCDGDACFWKDKK